MSEVSEHSFVGSIKFDWIYTVYTVCRIAENKTVLLFLSIMFTLAHAHNCYTVLGKEVSSSVFTNK